MTLSMIRLIIKSKTQAIKKKRRQLIKTNSINKYTKKS